jgi:hypothetical protein
LRESPFNPAKMEISKTSEKEANKEDQSRPVSDIDPADESENSIPKPGLTVNPDEEEYEYVTGWKLGLVVSIVTLTCFLILLDTSIIVTAIPKITTQFHSLGDVGWYGAAYLLTR